MMKTYCLQVFMPLRPSVLAYATEENLEAMLLEQVHRFPSFRRIVIFDVNTGDAIRSLGQVEGHALETRRDASLRSAAER